MSEYAPLCAALSARLGAAVRVLADAQGGCISRSFSAQAGEERIFVKTGPLSHGDLFAAEADGLAALAAVGSHRVPAVLAQGHTDQHAYLVLEYLDLTPLSDREHGAAAGRALAALHRHTGERYGWHCDNYLGTTRQHNQEHDSWPLFFARQRLAPMLALAREKGAPNDVLNQGQRVVELVPAFFLDYRPTPSLVHGDLWHGNSAWAGDQAALFDPALYFGDRELDVAMTELFGGFPESFYVAYREAYPLSRDYQQRKDLYCLYHILNHFNLFGAGYLNQVKRMLKRLLVDVRR